MDTTIRNLDPDLRARLTALFDEGWEFWVGFDIEVRRNEWHPFVPSDYERLLPTLLALREPGRRFLEWGSGNGVITIMADLLGFEAYGIELDAGLVETARALAKRHGSSARFETGSFIPSGYRWTSRTGDDRTGTIGDGPSAYPRLGYPLDEFDLVHGYPWMGEEALMLDLMQRRGGPEATLLLDDGRGGTQLYRKGRRVA